MMHAERRLPSWQPRRWYACIFIVFLVIIGVAGVSLISSYETSLQEEKSNLLHALSASAAETNKIILATSLAVERTEQLLLAPGRQGEITADPDAGTDIRNALIQEVAALPGVISMSVLDRHGKWSISSRFSKLPLSPDNPERPIWNAALQTKPGGFFVLDSSKSPVFDIPSLVLGRPVRDSSGALTGIVVAFIAVDSIRQAFGSLLLDGHQVMVSLPNGKDLVRIPPEHPHILDGMDSGLAKMMAVGEGILDADDGFGHGWIVAMHHSSQGGMDLAYATLAVKAKLSAPWWRFGKTIMAWAAISLASFLLLAQLWMRERRRSYFEAMDLVQVHSRLRHHLFHDPASELLNSTGFEQLLNRTQVQRRPVAIHVIGIEHLQVLADTLVPGMDNPLISQLSKQLRSCIGQNDVAARLAIEEFCVAQYEGDPDSMAETLSIRLGEKRYMLGERSILLSVCVGTAVRKNNEDWNQLLRDGRAAMERARSQGRGRFVKFEPSADGPMQEQLLLEQDFRSAIGTSQLFMAYQPICHVATGKISGFESLMRWNSPARVSVPPGVFIPMAERRGLLLPIDQMVERSPLLVANGWPSDISVSINCPAFEFLDPGMAVQLKEHLDRAGLNPERCYIEVTESALLQDDEQVLSVMRQVKALGVNLAIDDFGSGHASLSYLHRFPFNLIKIDRSFIQAMDKDAGAAAIVEATLALSRRLGLEVVAEGVETTEQFLHLQQLGCTYVQGFLIARPMNEEYVLPFLESFRLSDVLACPAHA